MDALNSLIGPYSGLLSLALSVAVVVLSLVCWRLWSQLRKTRQLWGTLSAGAEGGNLEALLERQLREVARIEGELDAVAGRVGVCETKLKSSKRYVGLVRYNAFEDVGGQQSFALAIYDEEGNGAVMTSQVGRTDARVFGKSLSGGRSEVSLTVEEEQAIEAAVSPRSRPRISP